MFLIEPPSSLFIYYFFFYNNLLAYHVKLFIRKFFILITYFIVFIKSYNYNFCNFYVKYIAKKLKASLFQKNKNKS